MKSKKKITIKNFFAFEYPKSILPIYEYEDLDKHFKEPKIISPFYNVKRIPRKMKKCIRKFWNIHYDQEDINVMLWYHLSRVNSNYHRFLIKKICEKYKY